MEFIIQCQNDYIQSQNESLQSIDRLDAKNESFGQNNYDRNEKTLPNILLTIPDFPNHINRNQESWYLGLLTKIQFHHNILNLTNPKPWTN